MADVFRDGLAVRRNVVDKALWSPAADAIAGQLARDVTNADPDTVRSWTTRSFVPDIETDRRLLDLFDRSPIADMIDTALAPYPRAPIERAQVQVRLGVGRHGALAASQPIKRWHCDGVHCPHLASGTLNTFQLLVGVLLSDVTDPAGGAVAFRAGGHRAVADFFADSGVIPNNMEVPPIIDTLPAVPVLGRAGDVVVAHHLTPHAVGINTTDTDRAMVYFRVRVLDHDRIAQAQMTNPWIAMPTLEALELRSAEPSELWPPENCPRPMSSVLQATTDKATNASIIL